MTLQEIEQKYKDYKELDYGQPYKVVATSEGVFVIEDT